MFCFTIRDLLWLTLLSAFAVAWCVDRTRLVDESQAIQERHIVLIEPLEVTKRLVRTESLLRELERKWKADEERNAPMRAEKLDESTERYLKAVRDPKNGFHYPVLLRDEPNP